jgi:predicted RNase H-like HicB family nuclease
MDDREELLEQIKDFADTMVKAKELIEGLTEELIKKEAKIMQLQGMITNALTGKKVG